MVLEYKNSNVYYDDVGKGPVVILLHGFLETSEMWKDFIPELSKNNRVISVDLLGHGQTDCIGYVHTMEDMAEVVLAVLNLLNITSAKCIGHSMGGYVALALAEKQPRLLTRLCLMNSTFEADSAERKILRKRAIMMARANYESLVRMSFTNLFAPDSKINFKNQLEQALEVALQTPIQGYIAGQEGMMLRQDRLGIFKNITGKKEIITGRKDTLINPENIKAKIKKTTIIHNELSGGHMGHIESKEELSYFLMRFIE